MTARLAAVRARIDHRLTSKGATTRPDPTRAVLTLGVVLYCVRVIAPGWRTGFPSFFPDSSSYVSVSRLGPLEPSFWWSQRPVGVPLLMWLSGGNHRVFFLAQTLLFALSIAFLCSVLLRVLSARWLAWTACAVVAAVAVHPRFAIWHLEILSESLSLTLSVFMIGVWLRFVFDPSRRWFTSGIAVTVLWMLVRDVHIVLGSLIAAAFVLWAIATRSQHLRRRFLLGALAIASCAGYVLAAQSVSDRNLYPLINNVGERVLPNADLTTTFVDQGMPMSEALRARTGSDTWSEDQAFLRSTDLADFRQWADDRGQRALLTSLVVDAPYWLETAWNSLNGSLPLDFQEYDRHSTSERLPAAIPGLQSPRSTFQLTVWLGIAATGLSLLCIARTRRRIAAATVVVLGVAADIVISSSGDSVEVQRHLLGSILRLLLIVVVIAALGAQSALDSIRRRRGDIDDRFDVRPPPRHVSRPKMTVSGALCIALAAVGTFGMWIALEHRSQDFDPQYARTIIERAARYGGTYYQNGVHNKGPLETAVYDSARLFTHYETYWFGISAYIIVVSLVLGAAAWFVARSVGATKRLAGTSAALIVLHFGLSESDYSGVLYSRNITTAMLALVVAMTVWDRPWSSPRRSNAVLTCLVVLVGLSVQTLLTTAFSALIVLTFLLVRRSRSTTYRRPYVRSIVVTLGTVAAAPTWYALRGSFDEFWSNWWTYARYMSSSTGRSLLNQIGLGAEKLFGYYQQRPGIVVILVAFVFLLRINWSRSSPSTRLVHLMAGTWLIAGWVELIVSQRYSSHYFSVIAVPTALIAVLVAVSIIDLVPSPSLSRARRGAWASILSAFALLATQGTDLAWIAVEGAGRFRSTAHYAEARRDQRTGPQKTRQAVLDLVSRADDPLLAWTMFPWTYLDNRRVPATRFSWKSFLIGEVYLGRTSPDYVLDRTWEWFAEDIEETQPKIYARPIVTELVTDTPFASLVTTTFTTVYSDEDLEIGWSTPLWTAVSDTSDGEALRASDLDMPAKWSFDPSADSISAEAGASPWQLPMDSCQKFSTRLVRSTAVDPMGMTFLFTPSGSTGRTMSLNIDFDRSWSSIESGRFDVESPTELDFRELESGLRTEMGIVLVVSKSTAALIVDGRIVSAVNLDGPTSISVIPSVDDLRLDSPSMMDLPDLDGC